MHNCPVSILNFQFHGSPQILMISGAPGSTYLSQKCIMRERLTSFAKRRGHKHTFLVVIQRKPRLYQKSHKHKIMLTSAVSFLRLLSVLANQPQSTCSTVLNLQFSSQFLLLSANLQNGVNNELQKVDEWMRYNKLSINYSKTTYMLINSNSSQSCNFKVKINDSEIKHTTCTKYYNQWRFSRSQSGGAKLGPTKIVG